MHPTFLILLLIADEDGQAGPVKIKIKSKIKNEVQEDFRLATLGRRSKTQTGRHWFKEISPWRSGPRILEIASSNEKKANPV